VGLTGAVPGGSGAALIEKSAGGRGQAEHEQPPEPFGRFAATAGEGTDFPFDEGYVSAEDADQGL
jgi:hypothetical protein